MFQTERICRGVLKCTAVPVRTKVMVSTCKSQKSTLIFVPLRCVPPVMPGPPPGLDLVLPLRRPSTKRLDQDLHVIRCHEDRAMAANTMNLAWRCSRLISGDSRYTCSR